MSVVKTSRANIRRPSSTVPIRFVEYVNPEIILPDMIQQYLQEVGYGDVYPNFPAIRVGAVHPFALLLYATVSGANIDMSLFPSITVVDSAQVEQDSEFGKGRIDFMMSAEDFAPIKAAVESKDIIASTQNVNRVVTALASGSVYAKKTDIRTNHTIDLNVWSDNKDLTSVVYDLIIHFITGNLDLLHARGLDVLGGLTGRRSGDINVEFGKVLYGANVEIKAVSDTASLVVDLPISAIDTITPEPTYHVRGDTL